MFLPTYPAAYASSSAFGDAFVRERHLATDVQEALRQSGRVARDQAALDQLVRIALHQEPVLVGAGLGLVAVDDEVTRPDALRGEAPLHAGRETGAAASEQRGVLDLLGDVGGALVERGLQTLVAVRGEVPLERVAVFVLEPRGHDCRSSVGRSLG